jgi:hypothetical protein
MKVGGLVTIRDGSYSACCEGEKLYEDIGIAIRSHTYMILLIQEGLPSFHYDPAWCPRKRIEYRNDVLLQDMADRKRLVYSQRRLLSMVVPEVSSTPGCKLADSLRESRAISCELFGGPSRPAHILKLAHIMLQASGHNRDIAFANCILDMRSDLD